MKTINEGQQLLYWVQEGVSRGVPAGQIRMHTVQYRTYDLPLEDYRKLKTRIHNVNCPEAWAIARLVLKSPQFQAAQAVAAAALEPAATTAPAVRSRERLEADCRKLRIALAGMCGGDEEDHLRDVERQLTVVAAPDNEARVLGLFALRTLRETLPLTSPQDT